jgi:hypothetical protein
MFIYLCTAYIQVDVTSIPFYSSRRRHLCEVQVA